MALFVFMINIVCLIGWPCVLNVTVHNVGILEDREGCRGRDEYEDNDDGKVVVTVSQEVAASSLYMSVEGPFHAWSQTA